MKITAGSTDVSISIYCRTLAGAALTGKVAADFALTYRRAGANVPLVLSNLASISAAHTDGGVYEVGQGEYRLDLPDAAVATGGTQVSVTGTVAGGVLLGYPIELEASMWAASSRTLTTTAAATTAAVSGSSITITQGYDFDCTLSGLTIPADRTELYFSVKKNRGDTEADAWVRISEDDGLERIYKAAPTAAANGSLTVSGDRTSVAIHLHAAETVKLVSGDRQLVYDLKVILPSGTQSTALTEGDAKVQLGITLAAT